MTCRSPQKDAVLFALRADEEELHRLKIVLAERKAHVQDALALEWECRDDIRRLLDEIENARDALKDIARMERLERRSTAA
jgi:hypothetical protein